MSVPVGQWPPVTSSVLPRAVIESRYCIHAPWPPSSTNSSYRALPSSTLNTNNTLDSLFTAYFLTTPGHLLPAFQCLHQQPRQCLPQPPTPVFSEGPQSLLPAPPAIPALVARQHPAALARLPRARRPQDQEVRERALRAVAQPLTTLPRTSRGFLTLIPIRDGSLRLENGESWFVKGWSSGHDGGRLTRW